MFEYRLWLAALPEPIPEAEARIYWNLKDLPTPTLDGALQQADYAYVGSWQDSHLAEAPQAGRCPAVRIFDWLFYRGTIDRYQAPILNARLRDELMGLYQPRPDDLPAQSTDADEIAAFLTAHLGWSLLPEESPGVDAMDCRNSRFEPAQRLRDFSRWFTRVTPQPPRTADSPTLYAQPPERCLAPAADTT